MAKKMVKIKELETNTYYNVDDVPLNIIFKIDCNSTNDRYMFIPPMGGGRILIVFSEETGIIAITDSVAIKGYFSNCKVFAPCACTICINDI